MIMESVPKRIRREILTNSRVQSRNAKGLGKGLKFASQRLRFKEWRSKVDSKHIEHSVYLRETVHKQRNAKIADSSTELCRYLPAVCVDRPLSKGVNCHRFHQILLDESRVIIYLLMRYHF